MNQLVLIASILMAACATEPDAVDEVAQESVSTSDQELARLVLQDCGMTRDGVTTYKGLTGTYQRLGLTGVDEPVRLRLVATQTDPDAKGTFSGTYQTATHATASYAGRFGAIPDNPAIGAALMLDTNSDGEYDKLYFVLAIRRSLGQVRGLCLVGADHPFLLLRTSF